MKTENIIHTDASGVVPIIAHHEKTGARPCSLRLVCPVKLLKKSRLTVAQLAENIERDAAGEPAIKPTPCPFDYVATSSHISAIVNFDYEGNVNAQRAREGSVRDFETQANWFEHITRAIVAHRKTGERYIFVRVLSNLSLPQLVDSEGEWLNRSNLLPYLPADKLTDTERAAYGLAPDAGNEKQALEKEITPITFKLANVRAIVIDGFTYIIDPSDAPEITPSAITTTKPAARPLVETLHRLAIDVANNPHAHEGQF